MRITIEISDTPGAPASAASTLALTTASSSAPSATVEALSGGAAPTGGGVDAEAVGGVESAGASKSDSQEFAPQAADTPTYDGGGAPR
jgi:hypothetical protein